MLSGFFQDCRYALRQLVKSPTFATTALLTLALGIAANVIVFAVLNAPLLRPLDVPQPGGLYNIVHAAHGYDNPADEVPKPHKHGRNLTGTPGNKTGSKTFIL